MIARMPASHSREAAEDRIVSPFSDAESPSLQRKPKPSGVYWIIFGLAFFLIISLIGFFVVRYLNDPLRVLEPFPTAKYFDGYKSLAGSKFRGNLRVENDLGWKEGVGRLMVFSVKEDSRPIVVMIPPSMAQIYFTKGQSYDSELEVKEGGLIYANSIRKN